MDKKCIVLELTLYNKVPLVNALTNNEQYCTVVTVFIHLCW